MKFFTILLAMAVAAVAQITYFEWDMEGLPAGFQGWHDYSGLTAAQKHTGDSSMVVDAPGDGGNNSCGATISTVPFGTVYEGKSLYMRAWVRWEFGFSWGTASNYIKVARFLAQPPDEGVFWTIIISDNNIQIDEDGSLSPVADNYYIIDYDFQGDADDQWHEYIICQKFESTIDSSDGQFKFYADGVLIDSLGGINYNANAAQNGGVAWGGAFCAPYVQLNQTVNDGGLFWVDNSKVTDYLVMDYGGATPSQYDPLSFALIDTARLSIGGMIGRAITSTRSAGPMRWYSLRSGQAISDSGTLASGQSDTTFFDRSGTWKIFTRSVAQ
jgi:hypothetical protein